jgi:3-oxoacyl-[acyl-carrier protein] reductase
MDLGLKGKHAVVCGGSIGIGAAIAKAFAAEGCKVSLCARNLERAKMTALRLSAELGEGSDPITAAKVDVSRRHEVAAWFDALGTFDIVVANASALSDDWDASIAIDLGGTRNIVEEAVVKISKGGAITYVGSKASSVATPGFESYGAVKAAMAHYVKSASALHASCGLRINVVSPGDTFVVDGFWDGIRKSNPQAYASAVAANPMGRLADADEIARVVAFISSPAASFVSGANWYVDGGSTRHVQT